jgi:hypothetical protein
MEGAARRLSLINNLIGILEPNSLLQHGVSSLAFGYQNVGIFHFLR